MIKIIHAQLLTSRYHPMECLNIDFVGPFPDGGYVLAIDNFKMGGVNARKSGQRS
jgi:hypothetical protein